METNSRTGLGKPWGFFDIEAPRFHDSWHIKLSRLAAQRTGRLYPPGNIPGTPFLLEDESTPGPECNLKDYANEKF